MSKNMQMKKETGKISHRKFLSENIGLLLIAPVFLLLMFTVSNLYQLPAEYVFYLTSIFLILWVTTLCMQYWGFRKRTEQYEKESKEKQESNSKESKYDDDSRMTSWKDENGNTFLHCGHIRSRHRSRL